MANSALVPLALQDEVMMPFSCTKPAPNEEKLNAFGLGVGGGQPESESRNAYAQ